jgi:hypothetical protein
VDARQQEQTQQGELDLPNSKRDDLSEGKRWFEYWFLGRGNGIMSEPAVQYYMMGAIENSASGNERNNACKFSLTCAHQI